MGKEVYVAAVGLTKVDLTGRIFASVFDLFGEAYRKALHDSSLRTFDALQVGIMDSEHPGGPQRDRLLHRRRSAARGLLQDRLR
jgi:hypothetical protein